jgi:hypothetical protein
MADLSNLPDLLDRSEREEDALSGLELRLGGWPGWIESLSFRMRADIDRQRRVAPAADLTDADRAGMHRSQHHLAAIVAYDGSGCGGVR